MHLKQNPHTYKADSHIQSKCIDKLDCDGFLKNTYVMCFHGQYFTLKDQPAQQYEKISLSQIIDLVMHPQNVSKENALATIGSAYCAYDARNHESQSKKGEYFLLRFDIDAGNPPLDEVQAAFTCTLGEHLFLIYSTSSATSDARRWRVLVPLLRPIGHELRRSIEMVIRDYIEFLFGFEFDRALDRAGQHIYLPAVSSKKRARDGKPLYYEHAICGEKPIDIESSNLYKEAKELIDQEFREEQQRQAALEERREKRQKERERKALTDGGALSPIDWFNQNNHIEDLLAEAGYEQSVFDPRNWRSPHQTSGSYATRVYDDYFVTLSGSDAAAGVGAPTRSGYRVGDAFSIFLHFMHADDKAAAFRAISTLRDFSESQKRLIDTGLAVPTIVPITMQELQSARLTPRVLVPDLLFADVRTRIAAGGSGKTTLAIFEAVNLALGRPIWGKPAEKSIRTVFITREDSRETLVARIREVMGELFLEDHERLKVVENLAILDFTDLSFRLSAVINDVVMPHRENLNKLLLVLRDWQPDWIICDPLISFGVGESRVNDGEQGLIEAFRLLRNELDCCVEGIHHTGKAVAREKILDQYAGRGGSALADGARMVVVMQPLAANEWAQKTGVPLKENQSGLVMAFPKLSYCRPQPPIYIYRQRHAFFKVESVVPQDPDQALSYVADQVHAFLLKKFVSGQRYSITTFDCCAAELGISRKQLRNACSNLQAGGRLLYHHVRGKSGAYFEPLDIQEDEDVLLGGASDNDWPLPT